MGLALSDVSVCLLPFVAFVVTVFATVFFINKLLIPKYCYATFDAANIELKKLLLSFYDFIEYNHVMIASLRIIWAWHFLSEKAFIP